jgi:hypothetical protein
MFHKLLGCTDMKAVVSVRNEKITELENKLLLEHSLNRASVQANTPIPVILSSAAGTGSAVSRTVTLTQEAVKPKKSLAAAVVLAPKSSTTKKSSKEPATKLGKSKKASVVSNVGVGGDHGDVEEENSEIEDDASRNNSDGQNDGNESNIVRSGAPADAKPRVEKKRKSLKLSSSQKRITEEGDSNNVATRGRVPSSKSKVKEGNQTSKSVVDPPLPSRVVTTYDYEDLDVPSAAVSSKAINKGVSFGPGAGVTVQYDKNLLDLLQSMESCEDV